MKNFRLTDGDLDITTSKRVSMVTGRDKLVQDLTVWLLEPLGTGYMTPSFGSLLNTMASRDPIGRREGRYIGKTITERRVAEIESEVDRVLHLYQQNQMQNIRDAQIQGRLYLYSKREVLDSIDEVATAVNGDVAIVRASIRTGINDDIRILAAVDDEEADVAAS